MRSTRRRAAAGVGARLAAASHATPVQAMQVHGDDGGERALQRRATGRAQALAWIVDVPALERQLPKPCATSP
jgi:hypothetical protein